MKRYILIPFILVGLIACKKSTFLDSKSTALNEEITFTDSARTMDFLVRIYSDAGFSFNKGRWDSHGNLEQASDEAEYRYSGTTQKAVVIYSGTFNPQYFPFPEFWNTPYSNIRRVNLLLSKLPNAPLSSVLQRRVAGEARFLRVWYYAYLLKSFGGVPIVDDKVFGINDIINLPRNNYEEVVNYLVKELDEAAVQLPAPADYAALDYGRVTKGACMALKSRILLYAASPLFSKGGLTSDPALSKVVSYGDSTDASVKQRWQKAAQAALDVMNSNYYQLNLDNTTAPGYGFYNVFLTRVNPEYIFALHRPNNRDMEGHYNPPSRGGAYNAFPTQNVVDDFPMRNGKAISDPTSGYDVNNPYVNRDPRFAYTVIYNTSLYQQQNSGKQAVFTYVGAPTDGFGVTTTGYYCRKMCDENVANNGSAQTQRGWPLIRYAEILLNYAEAINEAGETDKSYAPLKLIRERAGILPGADNLYGLKANMSQEEMRQAVQTERRIELAYEDQRFFDVRRWRIAMRTDNGYMKAMKITRNTNGTYSYERTVATPQRLHNFRKEMYLMPIPQTEISKMPAMLQNPGW